MKIIDKMMPEGIDSLDPINARIYAKINERQNAAFLRAIETGLEIVNVTYHAGTEHATIIGTIYEWNKQKRSMRIIDTINGFRNRESVYHVSLEEETQIRDIYEQMYGRSERVNDEN